MTTKTLGLNRRNLMKGLAGVVASPAVVGSASAQGKRLVIGTWGGDYGDNLVRFVEKPFVEPLGYSVVQSRAADSARITKLMAERRLPRGTTDLQAFTFSTIAELSNSGLLMKIDYSRLKNARHLIPEFRYDYGVGHIYTGMVTLYVPSAISAAPKSFRDTLDPKHGSKIGLIDLLYERVMFSAALAATGSLEGIEDGKKLLLEAKKAGAKIYPTVESFAVGMKSGEIGIGPMWRARSVQWNAAGVAHESVVPAEGIILHVGSFAIPHNANDVDGAYTYLDALLEPGAQNNYSVSQGMNPTITNANVDPALVAKIGFTAEEVKHLQIPSPEFLRENEPKMKEWWDRVFKAS